jgi:hypothetical protein
VATNQPKKEGPAFALPLAQAGFSFAGRERDCGTSSARTLKALRNLALRIRDYRQTPQVPPPWQWAHREQLVQTLQKEDPVQRPARTAAGNANSKMSGRSRVQTYLCVIFISSNTHFEREYLPNVTNAHGNRAAETRTRRC